jgi:hypothetical protein
LSRHLLATLHIPYNVSQVGLVGIILSKIALSWFAPLLKKSLPLLYILMHSLKKLVFNIWWSWFWKDCEHTNLKPMTMIHHVSTYAMRFQQPTSNVNWNEESDINQFYWGLQSHMKDLMLTMPKMNVHRKWIHHSSYCVW